MIKRVPVEYMHVHKMKGIDTGKILRFNESRHCFGNVDQYFIDDDGRLIGVISTHDIERWSGDRFDIEKILNKDVIKLTQSRHEYRMASAVLENADRIRSLPVTDSEGILLYFYIKLNNGPAIFENEIINTNIRRGIWDVPAEILRIENSREKKVAVYTDIPSDEPARKYFEPYIIDDIKKVDVTEGIVLFVYQYDYNVWDAVKECIENDIPYLTYNLQMKDVMRQVSPYFKTDIFAKEVLEEETCRNGNYFDMYDFQNIFQALNITKRIRGDYVEIGTYRGDSARAALSYAKKADINRKFYFLDTYEGFVYEEAKKSPDSWWANHHTHTDTSIDIVRDRLSEFNGVHLVKSNIITDGLPDEIESIAVCNIDVDMYEAVAAALDQVNDKMVSGGVIIAEDYGHTPVLIGAQVAIREFHEANADRYYGLYMQSGQFFMIRK